MKKLKEHSIQPDNFIDVETVKWPVTLPSQNKASIWTHLSWLSGQAFFITPVEE